MLEKIKLTSSVEVTQADREVKQAEEKVEEANSRVDEANAPEKCNKTLCTDLMNSTEPTVKEAFKEAIRHHNNPELNNELGLDDDSGMR